MQRGITLIILFIWLGIFSSKASAQIVQYDPITGEEVETVGGAAADYRTEEEKLADAEREKAEAAADTTKKKVKKPLLSFFFDDSTRFNTEFFAWTVNPEYNTVNRVPIDTLLSGAFQIDYPFMAIDGGIGSIYLGNYGSATIPINYFSRKTSRNFTFLDVWSTYIMTPEKTMFYNTRLPYSRLDFEMSGETSIEENLFHIVVSHNINPSTTFNINYNGEGTKGMYMYQNTLVFNLGLSFAHTGKNWAVHGGYIYNGGEITENGGITDDSFITDTLISSANQIDVNLSSSENNYIGHTLWWTGSYAIPLRALKEDEITLATVPSIYIGNSFNFTSFEKSYTATIDSLLYSTQYFGEESTGDTISQQNIDTRFFVQIQPYDRNGVVGLISAGIGGDFSTYNQLVPESYSDLYGGGGKNYRNNMFVYADIDGQISKYVKWNADANFTLLGNDAGDLDVGGNIRLTAFTKNTQKPMSLDASVRFSMTEPDYWQQQYTSNHFIWDNDFEKEISTKFEAKFSIAPINLEIGATYDITSNKIYYDSTMVIAQCDETLSNLGIYLKKDFTIGGMHLNHTLLMQLSSNDYVTPVPLASAYLSYFYKIDVVKDVLDVEIGMDGRYQTEYYGFGYNPALGQFYSQRDVKVGGFPYLDAFVSAKWKRMRVMIKAQNWNVTLFGGNNYFMVAHYPQNRLMLKFRFSWSFYD
ncbi:MAG: putative porin [Rikenellaceae bacterium]